MIYTPWLSSSTSSMSEMFATDFSPLRDEGHPALFPTAPSLELQLVLKDIEQLLSATSRDTPPGTLASISRPVPSSSSFQADPRASDDVLTALANMLNLDSYLGQDVPITPRASSYPGPTAVPSLFVPTSPGSVGRDDQMQVTARSLSASRLHASPSPGQDQQFRRLCMSSMSAEPHSSPNPLPPMSSLLGSFAAPKASVTSPKAHNPLYKTELCRSWQQAGCCRYGDKCQFAHGCEELRQVQRHPKFRTKVCHTFLSTGICPYGSRCRFIHSSAAPTL